MFTVEVTTRSITVSLPDRFCAIASMEGSVWHAAGFSADDARRHVAALNAVAAILPRARPALLFALYARSHLTVGEMGCDVLSELGLAVNAIANHLERVGDYRKDMPFVNDVRNAFAAI